MVDECTFRGLAARRELALGLLSGFRCSDELWACDVLSPMLWILSLAGCSSLSWASPSPCASSTSFCSRTLELHALDSCTRFFSLIGGFVSSCVALWTGSVRIQNIPHFQKNSIISWASYTVQILCINSPAQPERWTKVMASKAASCCLFGVLLFSQTFSCITSFSRGASCSCSFQRSSSVPGWMSRQTLRPNFPSTSSTLTLHSSSLWALQANLWRQLNKSDSAMSWYIT